MSLCIPLEPSRSQIIFVDRCEAAPREILVRYRLLGSMRKILKMKTHEQVMEAVGLEILRGSK